MTNLIANDDGKSWPEEEKNRRGIFTIFLDRIFYSYMSNILKKGSQLDQQRKTLAKESIEKATNNNSNKNKNDPMTISDRNVQELSNEDLFKAPEMMHSEILIKEFNSVFTKMKNKLDKDSNGNGKIQIELSDIQEKDRRKALRWIFMKTLWVVSKPTYIPAGMYQFITVGAQIAFPIILQKLLVLFEESPNSSLPSIAILFAVALFIFSIIDGLAQERHKFLAFQSGITIRAATANAIHNQMLQLSARGKENLLSGETTNLVAIDCQKLFEVFQEGHLVWSCPLSMVIVTILLLNTMGKSTLVGMASMVLLLPVVKMIVAKMMIIRRERASFTDKRVEVTTSLLQAMRFCKLNHYEEKFIQRLHEARKQETDWVRKELFMLGWTLAITVMTPVIASALTFITYALIDGGNVLTSSDTFTTLVLFSVLRFPINYIGKLIGKAAQGIEACQRIANFLDREINDSTVIDQIDTRTTEVKEVKNFDETKENTLLCVENGNFTIGRMLSDRSSHCEDEESGSTKSVIETPTLTKSTFTLSNINFSVKKSEVLCVVGPVASGKSTLLQALIGDVATESDLIGTKVIMSGNVAYASQSPFILNSTFRENILFGSEYKKDLYDRVIHACNLLPDLNQLGPAGDLTEIGERGVTLSGGQKARISIARCVYAQPSVALFDDVLSALDASTGKWIFERLFDTSTQNERLLSNSAVVLVTHASYFLSRVDNLMVLVRGKPAYLGNWDDLDISSLNDLEASEVIRSLRSSVQEVKETSNDNADTKALRDDKQGSNASKSLLFNRMEDKKVTEENNATLMTVEEREFGLSNLQTWLTWFKYAGGFVFVTMALSALFVDRFFYVCNELWLAYWTASAYDTVTRLGITFASQVEGLSAQYEFIKYYCLILSISFIGTAVRSQIIIQGGATCAERLFLDMINKVIYAPMSYFETTPIGRILNRLTYDVEQLDISLSLSMAIVMISLGWFVTGLVLQIAILPLVMCILIPVTVVYWLLLLYYRKSAVDLQRLDAVSRSPVQARLAESMDGCTTIRVFGKTKHFQNLFKGTVDVNTAAMMNFMASQRWLGARFQILGSFVGLFAALVVVLFNDRLRLETGIIAMLIIWSVNFTITLSFFSQGISEAEAYLTSVERLQDMIHLPQEKDHKTSNSIVLNASWPNKGNLIFDDVCLRYRDGLPLALSGLSFTAKEGQRVGICGRTGAGKSTIAAALFRLCELESGKIVLDGQDLSALGLADVRGRKNGMCIIPQDPVLFSGSLRECLDPWGLSTDDEILDAIVTVQVADAKTRGLATLEDFVDEGGRNYSVGERQLLCLARALLAKPKVLVLDEATASVDGETDAFIQQMIRERFRGTTLLTIAHRLNTIMDYDMVLVMDKGKVGEFGSPKELLKYEDGLFSKLVDSTGIESSFSLRQMAEEKS